MVTFKKPIGSISVSGHKFVGSPVPCGVVMTRLRHIKGVSSDVEYLNSRDATIMGSRNGHAPIYMWCAAEGLGWAARAAEGLCWAAGAAEGLGWAAGAAGAAGCLCCAVLWTLGRERRLSSLRHLTRPSHPSPQPRRYTFCRKGYEGLRKDVEKCLRNAHLLKARARLGRRLLQGAGSGRRGGTALSALPCRRPPRLHQPAPA